MSFYIVIYVLNSVIKYGSEFRHKYSFIFAYLNYFEL